VAERDLQVAQGAEDKARIDVETTEQRVRVLGGNPARPSPRLELRAPIAGAIVEQNVAGFEGVKEYRQQSQLVDDCRSNAGLGGVATCLRMNSARCRWETPQKSGSMPFRTGHFRAPSPTSRGSSIQHANRERAHRAGE